MKYLFNIFAIIPCLFGTLWGNDSTSWKLDGAHEGWKDEFLVLKYFHNSESQRQWAWHLLGTYRFTGNERILDFGCGDGKVTAEISHFVPQGSVLGVDLSPSMITFANRVFSSASYPNLSFKATADVDFTHQIFNEQYDLICSFCVFHLVANPTQVLSNLRECLADNGKLLIVIPCGSNPALLQAANEAFTKHQLKAPWVSKGTGTNSISMRTKEGCLKCLDDAGLELISLETLDTRVSFYNKQDLMEWMMGTLIANWQIPLDKADTFFSEIIDRMIELDHEVLDQDGVYNMKQSRFEIIATPL